MAKVFLWKACNNILPTKLNVFRKGIVPGALCPICGLHKETVEHVLWTCEAAKDVWSACRVRTQKCVAMEVDFISLFLHLREKLEADDLQRMVLVARQIWLDGTR